MKSQDTRKSILTLERAVKVCRVYDPTQAQIKTFKNENQPPPIKTEFDTIYKRQQKPGDSRFRKKD